MKALVVYESFFGNTEKVARAVAAALAGGAEVVVPPVANAGIERLKGIDLLVVGAPTRGFRPGPATGEWLKQLAPGSLKGLRVAAFDTRIPPEGFTSRILKLLVKAFGYAADPLAAELTKKGGVQALPPAGFIVNGTEGPLRDGEIERAAAWARQMVEHATAPS